MSALAREEWHSSLPFSLSLVGSFTFPGYP